MSLHIGAYTTKSISEKNRNEHITILILLDNMKRISFLLLLVAYSGLSFSQPTANVNLLDDEGKKDGLWIDTEYRVRYIYYSHGVEHGLMWGYYRQNPSQLFFIGEMDHGEMTGTWLYFYDDGHLSFRLDDFNNSNTLIPKVHRYAIKYAPHNCYCIDYHSNGRIKAEGRWFFFDSPELDDTGEYGLWKYYDEEGNLVKTVLFE